MDDSAPGRVTSGEVFFLLVITCVSKLRKGSSAALWSQCSSFVLQWRFKNIRIILLLLYFFLYLSHVYIDKAIYVLLLQQFSFIFVKYRRSHNQLRKERKTNTHDMIAKKFNVCTKNVYQFRMLPFLCWSSLW